MSSHPPSWGRMVVYFAACVISLQILADVLPRILPYLVVLAVIFVIVRLVIFHTRDW